MNLINELIQEIEKKKKIKMQLIDICVPTSIYTGSIPVKQLAPTPPYKS